MIGDIILAIKRVFKHNTCIHDYELRRFKRRISF